MVDDRHPELHWYASRPRAGSASQDQRANRSRFITLFLDRPHPGALAAARPSVRWFWAMQLDLVTIPAGPFAMGSEAGQPDERPVHEVWVGEFALAVHPVTNEEYR